MKILRPLIDHSTSFFCWMKRRRHVRIKDRDRVKVNLGSGLGVVWDWVNVDGSLKALVAGFCPSDHVSSFRIKELFRLFNLSSASS